MVTFTQRVLGQRNVPEEDNRIITLEQYVEAGEKGIQALNDAESVDAELQEIYKAPPLKEELPEGIYIDPEDTDPEELKSILKMAYNLSDKAGYNLEVMPSMESLSLERSKELLRIFLETTKRLIIRLWHAVEDYWESFLLRLTSLIQVSKRIKEEIQQKEGKSLSVNGLSTDKYSYLSTFQFEGEPLKDYAAITQRFDQLISFGHVVLNDWSSEVVKAGFTVIDLLENANVNKIDEELIRCNQITKELFSKLPEALRETTVLMSGVSLTFENSSVSDNGDITEQALSLMARKFDLSTTNDTPEGPLTLKPLTLNEMETMMDKIISLGETLREQVRTNRLPRLSANSKHLMNQGIRQYRNMSSPAEDTVQVSTINLTYRYAFAYGQWVRSPAIPISSLLVTVSRNLQMLTREMLALYK